jgi:uridine phosphorylase
MDVSRVNIRAACALSLEEWAVRRIGMPTVLVGIGCKRGVPEGKIIAVGVAGGLTPGLKIGTRVVANRIVDEEGQIIWEGVPLKITGAIVGTIVSSKKIYDRPKARRALYEKTGAMAVEMESHVLAGPMYQGCVRTISDTPNFPLALFSVYGGLKALYELSKLRFEL